MGTEVSPEVAVTILQQDAQQVVTELNAFTSAMFKTRGGRLGSGMGSLLEALWVYQMNRTLLNEGGMAQQCELGWLQDHEPADFACLRRGADWTPANKGGELFRIEAKSMNLDVDEAKGHFANLASETSPHDQLLVLVCSWARIENEYAWPEVKDYFLGPALPIIQLRDSLHKARGGSFVSSAACPDGCAVDACTHAGEPLNASAKRERRTGPKSRKPPNVDYAANFGGLLRMLKTDSEDARRVFRRQRRLDDVAHKYISFIHRHFSAEETNQYKKAEWLSILSGANIPAGALGAKELAELARAQVPNYQDALREKFG